MRTLIGLALCLAVLAVPEGSVYSQGHWDEYSLIGFGSGASLAARGDGCLGYTKSNAQILLVYDIGVGDWLAIDLGSTRTFQAVSTEGNVVFAYTDNLLIGYSAVTKSWDSVSYSGEAATGGYHYGCGDSLAYFLTRSYLYVFDAVEGSWSQYDYGLPGDYLTVNAWVKDDYVGIYFSRPYPTRPKNVVYSLHTHGFNQLEEGISLAGLKMDHGFARYYDINGDGKSFSLVGYSALSNTFDVVSYTCGTDEAAVIPMWPSTLYVDEFTAYAIGFRYVVSYVSATTTWYGFDTRRGTWDQTIDFVDWTEEHYYGNPTLDGQFVHDHSLYTDDASYRFLFYNGIDGLFWDYWPGLIYKSTTSAFGGGGTVFGAYDTLYGWGYDIAGDRSQYVELALDKTVNFNRGDGWFTITRYSLTADTMLTYFYSGNSNLWTSVAVPNHWNNNGILNPHLYVWNSSPENTAIFYSSYVDYAYRTDFTDDAYVYTGLCGVMAYARSQGESVLFDGLTGNAFSFPFNFQYNSIGTHSAAVYDTALGEMHGYSALAGDWASTAYSGDFYTCIDTGYIGLVLFSQYDTLQTYNGLRNSWVEFAPDGNHVLCYVGERTAIAVRSDRVYAFDPEESQSSECCGLYTGGYTGNIDCDVEGLLALSDITTLIAHIYLTHQPLCCPDNANVDGDAENLLTLSDITRLIDNVYINHTPTAPCP